MSSVRSLANLFCANCDEITVHRAERCIHCSAPNRQSGNPPVPRPSRQYGYATMSRKQYDHEAVQRARAARHRILSQRGRT